MDYIQYNFLVTPPEPGSDILIATIAEMGFDSFESNDKGFIAYLPADLDSTVDFSDLEFEDFNYSFTTQKMAQVNWNEWEKNFSPVLVNDDCIIRAPFHNTDKTYKYDLVIMPKMSFGTGHHDTTWLMCRNMLEANFSNKSVFDMGSGTGVLAILAKKLGATTVVGNDIDDWSVENAIENCTVNQCEEIVIIKGDGDLLNSNTNQYDIILANINKNVLKAYLPRLSECVKQDGFLFMSGFFKTDCEELIRLASNHYFRVVKQEIKNDWATIIFQKT